MVANVNTGENGSLWVKTPLVWSSALSARLNAEVYLKVEAVQKSRSFKGRGISHFANQAVKAYLARKRDNGDDDSNGKVTNEELDTVSIAKENARAGVRASPIPTLIPDGTASNSLDLPHLVVASGGNAGIAACSAARTLNLPITVFAPESARPLVPVFEREGPAGKGKTNVEIGGQKYAEAVEKARAFAKSLGDKGIFIPAYEDPLVWQGHATLIHEIQEQLPPGVKPDAVICSVGGAGLIGGVILGMEDCGWEEVPVIAMETRGCDCFYHSLLANRGIDSQPVPGTEVLAHTLPDDPLATYSSVWASKSAAAAAAGAKPEQQTVKVAHLPYLTSRATSLGATSPAPGVVKLALQRKGPVKSAVVSDERAMAAALEFLDDERLASELATSVALVPVYAPELLDRALPPAPAGRSRVLVFVMCGGAKASLDEYIKYKEHLQQYDWSKDTVQVEGEEFVPAH